MSYSSIVVVSDRIMKEDTSRQCFRQQDAQLNNFFYWDHYRATTAGLCKNLHLVLLRVLSAYLSVGDFCKCWLIPVNKIPVALEAMAYGHHRNSALLKFWNNFGALQQVHKPKKGSKL
ncbi:hypothetical protein PIB30_035372 [Stylosanthes scabra]|uniref:Uncharacterized protein n=1 Tax=Stylosanthes scabra TaxID=79078 RepID=A0ABU6XB66_9FABA|nr:hypothetical protein [Stylosanthes scabra]